MNSSWAEEVSQQEEIILILSCLDGIFCCDIIKVKQKKKYTLYIWMILFFPYAYLSR